MEIVNSDFNSNNNNNGPASTASAAPLISPPPTKDSKKHKHRHHHLLPSSSSSATAVSPSSPSSSSSKDGEKKHHHHKHDHKHDHHHDDHDHHDHDHDHDHHDHDHHDHNHGSPKKEKSSTSSSSPSPSSPPPSTKKSSTPHEHCEDENCEKEHCEDENCCDSDHGSESSSSASSSSEGEHHHHHHDHKHHNHHHHGHKHDHHHDHHDHDHDHGSMEADDGIIDFDEIRAREPPKAFVSFPPPVSSTQNLNKLKTKISSPALDKDSIKLIMMVLVGIFFLAELIFGIVGKSLALVSDSFHMLSDGISLIVGFVAIRLAKKKRSSKLSYGWVRAEILGGLMNGVFLLCVAFFIILEAIQRFVEPVDIDKPIMVLVVGFMGLVVNIIGMIIFSGHHHHGPGHDHDHGHGHSHSHGSHSHGAHDHHDHHHDEEEGGGGHVHEQAVAAAGASQKKKRHVNLNLAGVFLHILGDFLGSIGVMITGTIILLFGSNGLIKQWPWVVYLDPIVSLILSIIIMSSTLPLVKNCTKILLQSVPDNINFQKIETELKDIDGIVDVHEFHIWQLINSKYIASLHVVVTKKQDFMKLANKIKKVLHKHGVHSSTIQPEFVMDSDHWRTGNCALACAYDCVDDWCCAPSFAPKNATLVTPVSPPSASEQDAVFEMALVSKKNNNNNNSGTKKSKKEPVFDLPIDDGK